MPGVQPGNVTKNSRNIMEAILWKLRTGATWRDIPQEFCPWQTAYNRFNRWASKPLRFKSPIGKINAQLNNFS